jgi:hypothetical protein
LLQRFHGDGLWRAHMSKEELGLKLNMEALPRIALSAIRRGIGRSDTKIKAIESKIETH